MCAVYASAKLRKKNEKRALPAHFSFSPLQIGYREQLNYLRVAWNR